jgi:hypothetical protein
LASQKNPREYGQTVIAKQILLPKPGETKGQTVIPKVLPPPKKS